jgi:hypothetical protein
MVYTSNMNGQNDDATSDATAQDGMYEAIVRHLKDQNYTLIGRIHSESSTFELWIQLKEHNPYVLVVKAYNEQRTTSSVRVFKEVAPSDLVSYNPIEYLIAVKQMDDKESKP